MKEADTIQRVQFERTNPVLARAVGVVAALQGPLGILIVLADASYPRDRLAFACGLGFASVGLAVMEYRWQSPVRRRAPLYFFPLSSVACFIGMIGVMGGPGSPMTPLLFHPVLGRATREGTTSTARATMLFALLGMLALFALPDAWMGPPLAEPFASLLWVVMLGGVLATEFLQSSLISDAFRRAGGKLDELREALLRDHAAHAKGLETIGAKVAHELKNPLTSIKALLQLMGDDAAAEPERERYRVLNAEVVRCKRS
ncbi:MAG: histidine kinase dimerization/phospho-acceptor domain-containing protein [Myxococcota bacterium]